ncbi:mrna cleavage and polyadenylation specificity factor complex subunit pta1 [Acrodontium crateriforme]|uniref:Mrna cleavage and polyadenylation specificity factor complex subunit pta1 n=1 Tax=Acrodontium crateriforme TaxID=150365 RepID=A0AAQ3R1Y2_9PEZI|nr:mrna cleavage and polyadenylation specificity factor complex subunit pta1 [Acrodontium crateriforme]
MGSPAQVIEQLNSAREIVLKDAAIYPQVVPGVLPVIGESAHVELRRWGAAFLAETFASPVVRAEEKQSMALGVLDTLRQYLMREDKMGEIEDTAVVKSSVQCAASIYPLIFRHTIANSGDQETWSAMAAIKSRILRVMDGAVPGVRICCIKFVARVVQVQTPGLIANSHRPEQNEISLSLVPRDHPVVPPNNLEAEASGLLDRLLGVLQDNLSDALIVTATLNSLAPLVQRRPTIAQKVLGTVLNFNPLASAKVPMTGKDKVVIRSMTRTTMSFLVNALKRNPNHPSALRLQGAIEGLRRSLIEVFSDNAGKRSAPDEPVDGSDDAKRRRIDEEIANGTSRSATQPSYAPLPPGPVTVAQLFTLSQDTSATAFHVELLPANIVAQLIPPLIKSIDTNQLNDAINVVRQRYLDLSKQSAPNATLVEDDDDYDPSSAFPGLDNTPGEIQQQELSQEITIGPFRLPAPLPLTTKDRDEHNKMALTRVFDILTILDQDVAMKGMKKVEAEKRFDRRTVSTQSRDGWIILLTRLATRTPCNLGDDDSMKTEGALAKKAQSFGLANSIRMALMNYVMEDFRRRIDVAIAWLSEEWYAETLISHLAKKASKNGTLTNYWTWTVRLLDALTPYLDTKDGRILIRFLSEIPAINVDVLARVKKIALDPERVNICSQSLLYLIMFRPPVRELCVDVVEQMWHENAEAKAAATRILVKWRPAVVEKVQTQA